MTEQTQTKIGDAISLGGVSEQTHTVVELQDKKLLITKIENYEAYDTDGFLVSGKIDDKEDFVTFFNHVVLNKALADLQKKNMTNIICKIVKVKKYFIFEDYN